MRLPACVVVVLLTFGSVKLLAQAGIQRGRIKAIDSRKGTVTITAEGQDREFAVEKETQLRAADNKRVNAIEKTDFPEGTAVMFRVERRGERMVLTGLRVADPAAAGITANPPRQTIGVKPLTELGVAKYKGESGGLYGDGRNEPPAAHFAVARNETAKIRPLDAQGQPSPEGRIVLLAIGMSNTTQEFSMFKAAADRDPQKSPHVVIVDGAQGGRASEQWLDTENGVGKQTWDTADSRIRSAGVTNQQVQVIWIKQAIIQQGRLGEFPKHAQKLESDLVKILQLAKQRFPNLRVAYLSSRIYAGYAATQLNPEPYAFEGAFSVRWVIQSQIKGDPKLNFDAERGPVNAPIVMWGPYLWGDGTTPRTADGLVWTAEDFANDGTHPSNSGRRKVSDMLMKFFTTDQLAKTWFVR